MAFRGVIETPGRKIAVVTAELQKIVEIGVQDEMAEVTILVNDIRFRSVVLVKAS